VNTKIKFQSAVGLWYYVLALGFPVAVLVYVATEIGFSTTSAIISIAVAAILGLGLPVWLLLSTYYIVDANNLAIHSGPFHWSVPLKEIKSVVPSSSVMSSPALSLRRLEIQYSIGKSILVSPKDMKGFKRAIGQI